MTLSDFFAQNPSVALAFSGGVDSAYLLWAAKHHGAKVRAYYVKSPFQPQFEQDDATRLAKQLGVPMTILPVDILSHEQIAANPANRCYFCKKQIFSTILSAAAADGFPVLLDGTNASDAENDRPGMQALRELQVRSPLRECGLTKEDIRALSREAGLFTWDKPAYACLATRIPTGERITGKKLQATEQAEQFLFSLGFSDFRIRMHHGDARLQLPANQLEQLLAHREQIVAELKKYYPSILLDLEVRP